jgi:hypothetical protein
MRVVEVFIIFEFIPYSAQLRCDRPCMVSRGSLPCLRGSGFSSVDLEWFYPRYASSIAKKNCLFNMERLYRYLKNEYAELISTMDLSKAFVGIRLGSSWQLNLTIVVSKFGAQRTGNLKLKFESLSKTLPGARFSDDSGELDCFTCMRSCSDLGISWSPDGAHITASNATNNKGFVFIAAVIARNSWTSEISLVGHENTVEVAVSVCTAVGAAIVTDACYPGI